MSHGILLSKLNIIHKTKLTSYEYIFIQDMNLKLNQFKSFKGNQLAKVLEIIKKYEVL